MAATIEDYRAHLFAKLANCQVPDHCRDGLVDYFSLRHLPGGFLTAVLENNLMEAFGRADDTNRSTMFNYVDFLYNYAPAPAWGSPAKVLAWVEDPKPVPFLFE